MSKPLVLITRPADDATEIARLVAAMGFETILAPALIIKDTPDSLPDFNATKGLIFSSAHGVRALMRQNPPQGVFSRTIFAVGDHTAKVARDSGFSDVHSAAGTMADLIALIRQSCPAPVSLVHVSGAAISADLAQSLPQAEGWRITRVILYDAMPVDHLSVEAVDALKTGRVSAILFYSARSAESFLAALVKDWPEAICRTTRALCLAPPVVDSVHKFNLPWAAITVSETPDQAGMLALLETLKR